MPEIIPTRPPRPPGLRILVAEDSLEDRGRILDLLHADPEVEVVGCAGDGEEALRLALELVPGCICLDLQMPRMDGFTFLRVLMSKRPTPVIVISASSRKQDVFKALELGALDFVAKPDPRDGAGDLSGVRDDLLAKVALVRALAPLGPAVPLPAATAGLEVVAPRYAVNGPDGVAARPRITGGAAARPATPTPTPAPSRSPAPPARLVVIGASTGGPAALGQLLAALPHDLPVGYAVAQHMPRPFTGSFAERLAKTTAFDVREAQEGDQVAQGRVLVAPGGRHLRLVRAGGPLAPVRAALLAPDPRDGRRYCPSVDVLFESAAEAMGDRVCAVVLTGMGNDGRAGIAHVKEAGGLALAESESTAVVFGMPREAVETGKVDAVLSLEEIVLRVRRFAEGQG